MRWTDELRIHQTWGLEQERAKVVMLVRHIQRLRLQRILTPVVRSADAFEAHHQPYYDALERAQRRWLAAYASLPEPAFKLRSRRARLTKENIR
jgi:transposase-like protein